jgi:hypothetical protein
MDGTYTRSFDFVCPTISNPAWKIAGQGDFNADSRTDILWRNTSNGQTLVWFMNGVDYTSYQAVSPTIADTNWNIAGVGDFNGDGKPDLLWRNNAAGIATAWLMTARRCFPTSCSPPRSKTSPGKLYRYGPDDCLVHERRELHQL